MCEAAVGYGGLYDPLYAYAPSGTIFATSFNGLKANRDGCTFAATPPGTTFVSAMTLAPDGSLLFAAGDATDSNIYRSTDDGQTFPQAGLPGKTGDYWLSLVVDRATSAHVFVSGYRFTKTCDLQIQTDPGSLHPIGKCETHRVNVMAESTDGGLHFTQLLDAGIALDSDKQWDIVGIDGAGTLYLRSALGNRTDAVFYRLAAGDTAWTQIFTHPSAASFLVRASGELVVGTQLDGSWASTDGGRNWTALVSAPHINCLTESAAGEVWACTQDKEQSAVPNLQPEIPADGFGMMKSTDLATWTGVMRYEDIVGPVACAADTTQTVECVDPTSKSTGTSSAWCCTKDQLGITSTVVDCGVPGYACGPPLPMTPDVTGDTTPIHGKAPAGCCDGGGGGATALVLLAFAIGRRRRR
jgi:hypothetical protein